MSRRERNICNRAKKVLKMRKWQRNTGQDLPMIQDQGFFSWLQSTGRVAGNAAIWVANNLIDAYNLYQTYQAVTGQTGGGMTGPIPNIPSIPNGSQFASGFGPSAFQPTNFSPTNPQPIAPSLPASPGMPAPAPTPPTRTRSGSRDRGTDTGIRSTGTRTRTSEPTRRTTEPIDRGEIRVTRVAEFPSELYPTLR